MTKEKKDFKINFLPSLMQNQSVRKRKIFSF